MMYADYDTTIDYLIINNMYYQLTNKEVDWESIAEDLLKEDYLKIENEDILQSSFSSVT